MERKGIGMKGKMLKEVQFVDDEHEKFFLDNIEDADMRRCIIMP